MKLHKLQAGEKAGSYVIDSPVTEADILRMAQQLANRRMAKGKHLGNPQQAAEHLQTLLQDLEHEVFALLMLDSKNRIIGFREVFRGTIDTTRVYPREVAKTVLKHNAASVVLVHNHPSGDPEPSQADYLLTKKLKTALELVGTRTLDHIVVGREGFVSLAQLGYL
ncbi:DNA repair protein RadC [Pseudomonas sp. ABC1]|uniref:RadC family protein n=1 Tax=Pseudomonas sp. ABC1 TaxID=2748080 RepID=UPI0015C336BC|nr:DNA repair protein RadC [Pseudomonas sp. ABC1]QLF94887.1 DNA repair protein RadC [Pseudomonas sp. ABC1]